MVSVMMDKIHSPFCGNNAFLGSREALTRAFSEGKGVIFRVTVFLAENTVYRKCCTEITVYYDGTNLS